MSGPKYRIHGEGHGDPRKRKWAEERKAKQTGGPLDEIEAQRAATEELLRNEGQLGKEWSAKEASRRDGDDKELSV